LIASGFGKIRKGGDKVLAKESIAKLYGLVEGGKEGLINAAKTFVRGEPTDPLTKIEARKYKAIPGLAGDVIRLPGRALMAEDEFFKSIGYRMELNALAVRKATEEGYKGRALSKRITEIKQKPPEEIKLAAINQSRYQTFTKPLGETGQAVQKFANSHPAAKVILPFIRTPTNIVKFAGERSPFALLSKKIRADIKAGGAKADIAKARIAMGSTIGVVTAHLAAEGKITGGGPSNPDARNTLYATGWQPYSIKIGDEYFSYSRLEPLGMMLGISADLSDISGQITEKQADEVAARLVGSISKNLVSKTWLKGASDLVEMIQDPDRYGERFIQNYAGTLIPTGVAQLGRTQDPVLRRTDDILDKLKSRIPGYSKELLPRRNVWGEPIILQGGLGLDLISPIYTSLDKKDKTSDEIVRLGINITSPGRKVGPIKLTPELHDELVTLTGRNLKRTLDGVISKPGYEDIPDGIKTEIINNVNSAIKRASLKIFFSRHQEVLIEKIQSRVKKLNE
jgi:hypothetical protein